ncbi:2-dehydropantoate 2-reductase [Pseudomonas sp. JV449]|jgi:2-dehydropantoate 2-reductase|uniref:ketopantoate reductase family protein n=1 Tax=Pseudomonas sp. JV449 TaxID=1890658 RepID=UPI0028E131E5|nr:2-dehydropantoate 2-reductase [Pseudomonas sp. JV449]MDT9632941.1 2-dehydropantoate 2-reductase [Pseudomonas sp. JV449]
MKVCVYGAGAVGGHIAARLAEGGAEVSLVARGEHLAAIRANGLRVETKDGVFESRPVATDDPASLGQQDVVIVSVKAPALQGVAAGIKPLLGDDTLVLFALNGIPWWYLQGQAGILEGASLPRIDPESLLSNAIGPQRTVGAVAYTACTVIAPGVIKAENPRNRLILGRPDGKSDERLEALAGCLVAGGLEIEVTDRIRDAIWTKLVINLTGGSLAILTGSTMKQALASPAITKTAQAMAHEAAAIARKLGCDAGDVEDGLRRLAVSTHKQSILQDLELGRSMEVDTILRAPLELARLAGVQTPALDLVVDLAVQRARAAGLYDN